MHIADTFAQVLSCTACGRSELVPRFLRSDERAEPKARRVRNGAKSAEARRPSSRSLRWSPVARGTQARAIAVVEFADQHCVEVDAPHSEAGLPHSDAEAFEALAHEAP